MANYHGPLTFTQGADTSTVVDPRFGTGTTPTQPSGWGGGGGGSTPAPLTGDTYSAPGLLVPGGALDIWRTARDTTDTDLVEVSIFGDSTTYGSADPTRGDDYYSWVRAVKDAATADGHPDGGHGQYHEADYGNGYVFSPDAPSVTAITGNWRNGFYASRSPWTNKTGNTTDSITITGNGTAVRLTFVGAGTTGKAAYSVDGGPETVIDTYYSSSGAVPYEPRPVFISGLSNGPHAVKVRTAGPSDSSGTAVGVEFHIEFVRDNGLVFHRNATSGSSLPKWFRADINEAATESMAPFWLGRQSLNTAGSIAGARYEGTLPGPRPAYRNTKLAIIQFGTNDLGGADHTSHDAAAAFLENVAYFASTCRAIGCSGLVIAPPWTQLPSPGATGTRRVKAALPSLALAFGIAYADFQEPIGYDLVNWAGRHNARAGSGGSHIAAAAYQMEGTWLWEHLLAL